MPRAWHSCRRSSRYEGGRAGGGALRISCLPAPCSPLCLWEAFLCQAPLPSVSCSTPLGCGWSSCQLWRCWVSISLPAGPSVPDEGTQAAPRGLVLKVVLPCCRKSLPTSSVRRNWRSLAVPPRTDTKPSSPVRAAASLCLTFPHVQGDVCAVGVPGASQCPCCAGSAAGNRLAEV